MARDTWETHIRYCKDCTSEGPHPNCAAGKRYSGRSATMEQDPTPPQKESAATPGGGWAGSSPPSSLG